MPKKWTYEATKAGYGNLWRSIVVKNISGASRFARIIAQNEARYRGVSALTGVPWYFIGALHMRESSCNFAGVLHNGEHIIGKKRKTRLVPAGRGPFETWEEAAVDALKLKGLHKIKPWSIQRMGYHAEEFNGWGYAAKGINSPYLWAGSNHQRPGKYVADHVFDPTATDTQMGVMTVLKRLCEIRPDIDVEINRSFVPNPPDVHPDPPFDVPKSGTKAPKEGTKEGTAKEPWYKRGFIGWILGGLGSLAGGASFTITDELIYALCALIAVGFVVVALWVYVIPPRGSFKVWR